MPTTLVGLLVFVGALVPGFVNYVQRRRHVPQSSLSPLVETATLLTTSLLTNAIVLGAFGVLRVLLPQHTPDIRLLVVSGGTYIYPRLGYLALWAAAVLTASCGLAALLGAPPKFLRTVSRRFAPLIVDTTSWIEAFDEPPDDAWVFVGCDLRDGSYISGYVEWFSTELDETGDRDVMLTAPITVKREGTEQAVDFQRAIVSARDIIRLYVSYVAPEEDGDGDEAVENV